MAVLRKPVGSVAGLLETGRLGGRTSPGSQAFYRKAFTGSTRGSMADVIAKYSSIINRLQGVTPEILREALEPVFEKSQEYVPVDTGALKDSGQLTTSESARGRARAVLSYGGPSAMYAAIVHERTDLNHEPPTRAKFLQSAMEEEFDSLLTHLAVLYSTELRQ